MAIRLSTGLANAMVGPGGSSMADALEYGVIRIYNGSQPADADSEETGTLIVEITKSSAASSDPMTSSNGLSFQTAEDGSAPKTVGEVWSGTAVQTLTAGWFRFYDLDYDLGDSTTAVRYDGSIGTSGADMNLINTSITSGGTVTLDNASITLPLS